MKTLRHLTFLVLVFAALAPRLAGASDAAATNNKAAVRAAFDAWRAGTGGPFALLADDATWTITGNSLAAGAYPSRAAFIEQVIAPFNARLLKPLVPTVRGLHADGDTVTIRFDGEALALDGRPYRNTYAWFMRFRDGRVVEVFAFFDSHAFDEFWRRVTPAKN